MLLKLKINTIVIATVVALCTALFTLPYKKICLKKYDNRLNFTCAKKQQLVLHKYYSVSILGYQLSDGYETQTLGAAPNNYQVQCLD